MRTLRRVLLVLAGMVGALFVMSTAAEALEKPAVTVNENDSFERKYDIIAGNNPLGSAHTPEVCKTSVYCDVIPLTITKPANPDFGYFVRIQMLWKTRAETDVPRLGEMTNNDMDMYVYLTPYDTNKEDQQNQAASGATGAQPEVAYVDPAGDYNIVVVNFLGVNEEGYTLIFTYVTETVFTPFELLDDGRPAPVAENVSGPVVPPLLPSLAPTPFLPVAPGLAAVANFDDPFGLGRRLGSNLEAGDIFRRADNAAVLAAAKPVSAAAAMFWLVGFPLLLVGLGGAFFMRRRTTALQLGT